jgi:type II secretory pathway pseudopilin PulG
MRRRTARRFQQPQRRGGYTLINLLVLLAILGVVTAATTSIGVLAQRRWAEEELLMTGADIAVAIRRFHQAAPPGQRRYPQSLDELLRDPRIPGVRRYLRDIPIDPTTGKADWQLVLAPEGGVMGVHSASAAKPLKVAQFEPQWVHFADAKRHADWLFCHPACVSMRSR